MQFAAVMAKIEASPELVRVGEDGYGRLRFSTREMVEIERRLVATAVALNRSTTHRVNDKRRIGVVNGERKQLSAEQVLAYLHVTRSRDLVVVVGIAGGGKSTMLGTAREVWEGQGYRVWGAALAGIAAEGLQGSSGITSRTLASWEYAWEQGQEALTAKDVLVLDEAGMIGSRQLGQLIERVNAAGAKLVLVGDAEQLQAIEAGAAFRAIAGQVGAIAITEPRRQHVPWQREATKELATARTAAALDRYEAAGMVHRHATVEAAMAGVIAAWDDARRQDPRQSQIILTHRRDDVRALNEAARAVRRAAGELGPDHALQTALGTRAFAEGDRLYFLRNERGLGVKNGTLGTLERIEAGRLTVRLDEKDAAGKGRAVAFDLADYADIDHGYAATVHKNQGATVDQVHVLATPGMDRHLTYVALSRHRQAVRLHWSDDEFVTPERLRGLLGRERAKDTTLDYAEPAVDPVDAYAERRGLDPLRPNSEVVVRREATAPARRRPQDHVGVDPPAAGEKRPSTKEAPAEAPPSRAPKRGRFAGLRLNAAPQASPAPVVAPEPALTPLALAVASYLEAELAGARMREANLPLLPHQTNAVSAGRAGIDAVRPGFLAHLVKAIEQQPTLARKVGQGGEGVDALIAAGERVAAEREGEARRKAEHDALAPIRARLLEKRMEPWWRAKFPYLYPQEVSVRGDLTRAEAEPVKAELRREIEAMSASALRQVEADWARDEQQAAQEAALRPRSSGPSPG